MSRRLEGTNGALLNPKRLTSTPLPPFLWLNHNWKDYSDVAPALTLRRPSCDPGDTKNQKPENDPQDSETNYPVAEEEANQDGKVNQGHEAKKYIKVYTANHHPKCLALSLGCADDGETPGDEKEAEDAYDGVDNDRDNVSVNCIPDDADNGHGSPDSEDEPHADDSHQLTLVGLLQTEVAPADIPTRSHVGAGSLLQAPLVRHDAGVDDQEVSPEIAFQVLAVLSEVGVWRRSSQILNAGCDVLLVNLSAGQEGRVGK